MTRAEQQEITRQRVLTAAKTEFAQRGFRAATVDGIAERAELTRGAVYSNFPGKRALYFAVLAREAEQAPPPSGRHNGHSPSAALGMFARTWVQGLPRITDYHYDSDNKFLSPALSLEFIPEIMIDERVRRCFAQLISLDAILLAATLDELDPQHSPTRSLRIAEAVLTILYGATQLSFAAPGATDPDHVIALCEHVAHLEGEPVAPPAPRATAASVTTVDEPWSPPAAIDRLHNKPARTGSGIVSVLGMNRISAIREILRASPQEHRLTLVIVTNDPAELAPLARLAIADFSRSLRHAFPARAIPDIQIIVDEAGATAAACGLDRVTDDTEFTIATGTNRITARAEGPGAFRAVAEHANQRSTSLQR
ncbi:TetR/AcrR family transcriptional regulator [Nocardia alni]|uniref:TetR/AcrR family transcriptional regulator n=1 Tax=Nocardia alni TaxID=2815723 RepID=UPI0020B29213|nr:TetR/AcrR family transcriptional regulator [Nocardia alni]